jgi:hypothetical protein
MGQREWLTQWFGQQFPMADAAKVADVMTRYYALNFIRKPEFMGFNGYNDGIKRTEFNPNAWGISFGQNYARQAAWAGLASMTEEIVKQLPDNYASGFEEVVRYPVEASALMNDKLLAADLTYLDTHDEAKLANDTTNVQRAYNFILSRTAQYNALENGKWDGMMSDAPRERHVFEMPRLATAVDADTPLPASWGAGGTACQSAGDASAKSASAAHAPNFAEQYCTVSINAAHFARSGNGNLVAQWRVLADLGISGSSVVFGEPGRISPFGPISTLASAQGLLPIKGGIFPWLEYDFTTTTAGPATLALHLLPTFALDSDHKLRYAVALDDGTPVERDMSGSGGSKAAGAGDGPSGADWPQNVLRNSAIDTIPLGNVAPGKHTLKLLYGDPGVVFEHIVITFPGAPPAYPVPPETK